MRYFPDADCNYSGVIAIVITEASVCYKATVFDSFVLFQCDANTFSVSLGTWSRSVHVLVSPETRASGNCCTISMYV